MTRESHLGSVGQLPHSRAPKRRTSPFYQGKADMDAQPKTTGLVLKKKTKRSTMPSDGDPSSFFCRANPEHVIELVTKTVAEVESAPKKRRISSGRSPILGAELKISVDILEEEQKDKENIVVIEDKKDEKREDSTPIPENLVVLDDSSPIKPFTTDPFFSLPPKVTRPPPVVNKPKPKAQETTLDQDIDPELKQAVRWASRNCASGTEVATIDLFYTVSIRERLISQDVVPGAPLKTPLDFRITNKTTFGDLKQSYCKSRKISMFDLVLTYKETILFDSVRVSKSGLEPDSVLNKIELFLYAKPVLEFYKQEHKRQVAANLELLTAPLTDTQSQSLDVSDLMHDEPTSHADDLLSIKIQVGRTNSEVFKIASDANLSDLLGLYCEKHPEADPFKARFVFDGDVLRMSQSIDDAGLEDDDQLELRF